MYLLALETTCFHGRKFGKHRLENGKQLSGCYSEIKTIEILLCLCIQILFCIFEIPLNK